MSFTIDRRELDSNSLLSLLDKRTRAKLAKFKLHHKRLYLLTLDDRFLVFGDNAEGLLGLGKIRGFISQPVELAQLSGKQVVDIAVGPGHCLVLTAKGQVYGFGFNQFGQLGVGIKADTFEPLLIIPENIVAVRCGSQFSLALTANGRVLVWGSAKDGRLGCVVEDSNQYYPMEISKLSRHVIVDIQVGLWHSFALTNKGRVYGWGGSAFYQLGLGRRSNLKEPQAFNFTKEPIKTIRCGAFHTLFLTTSGRVYVAGLEDRLFRQLDLLIPKPIDQIVIINYRFAVSTSQEDLLMVINKNCQVQLWSNQATSPVVTSNKSMLNLLQNCATYLVPNEMFTVKDDKNKNKKAEKAECLSSPSPTTTSSGTDYLHSLLECQQEYEQNSHQAIGYETGTQIPSINPALKMSTAFHRWMDTDVEFVFPDRPDVLRAHRTVLMLASNYMNLLFSSENMVQEYNRAGGFIRVPVVYFPYPVFGHYLRFLYTNNLNAQLTADDLLTLTQISSATNDSMLSIACLGYFVKSNVCVENCCQLFVHSLNAGMPEMIIAALLTFIIENYEAVIGTEGYGQLDENHKQRIHRNFVAICSLK